MKNYSEVKLAFDSRLSTFADTIPVAWENVNYEPTLGQMYIRPTLITSPGELAVMNYIQRDSGLYQIDIIDAAGTGVKNVMDKMLEVTEYFRNNNTIYTTNGEIFLRAINSVRLAVAEPWIIGTVQIDFTAYY